MAGGHLRRRVRARNPNATSHLPVPRQYLALHLRTSSPRIALSVSATFCKAKAGTSDRLRCSFHPHAYPPATRLARAPTTSHPIITFPWAKMWTLGRPPHSLEVWKPCPRNQHPASVIPRPPSIIPVCHTRLRPWVRRRLVPAISPHLPLPLARVAVPLSEAEITLSDPSQGPLGFHDDGLASTVFSVYLFSSSQVPPCCLCIVDCIRRTALVLALPIRCLGLGNLRVYIAVFCLSQR